VNINTASAAVLACLVGGDTGVAQQLVNYRQSNPNNLTSIAWVIDALGQSYQDALAALAAGIILRRKATSLPPMWPPWELTAAGIGG